MSTLARIFEEAFTKPSYPLEDFLDHTYATVRLYEFTLRVIKAEAEILVQQLIEGELKQRIKKDPAVDLDEPYCIFKASDDVQLDPGRNIVESLWAF